MTFAVKASDWALLSPEIFLTAAGLLLLAISVFVGKEREEFLGFLATVSVVVTGILVAFVAMRPDRKIPILGDSFVVDNFALFFKGLVLL
ncbi:MAG: hypothetical protein WAU32_17340, partial [Thermoanaerobaculia bacterium]